jgi:CelD/BcsL family acetyltransferase involved in cellulose biosynthesis
LSRDAERIQDFVAVYATSWKRPEPYPEFIPALAQMCASLGILRLGTLYVDGEPAASQLWITMAKKALIYKLAYKDRFRDFSVGSILSLELFRQAIDEDRVEEIDYGVGSEPYKKDWMEDKRQLYGLAAFNLRTISGLALAGLEKTKQALHDIAHRDPAGPTGEPCPN